MQWSESVEIDAPADVVRRAVADEHQVMQWSAWPEATGYVCSIEGDGLAPGSEIVFRDKTGTEQGRQRLASVSDSRVEYRLRNRGPGGREMTPSVDFRIESLSPGRTRVWLDFEARAPLPPGLRHVAEALLGRRVRALHRVDLEQLKTHVEAQVA